MIYSKWQKELFKGGQICNIVLSNFQWITVDKRIMDGGVVIRLVLRKHPSKGRETRLIEDERGTHCSSGPWVQPLALSVPPLHCLTTSPSSFLFFFNSLFCLKTPPIPTPPTHHQKDLRRSSWGAQCQLGEVSSEARKISVILGLTSLWKKSH